jgi:hypothetical protein
MLEKNKTKNLSTKKEKAPVPAEVEAKPQERTPEEIAEEETLRRDLKEAAWRRKREKVLEHEMRTRIVLVEMLNNETEVSVAVAGARASEGLSAMLVEDGGCYEVEHRAYLALCQYAEAKHFKFITLKNVPDGLKPVKLSPKR